MKTRLVSLFLCLMLVLPLLCAPASAESQDVVEMTWLTTGDSAATPIQDDDRIIEEIARRTGVKLKMQLVPEADVTKVNVAMAASDLPDIVTGAYGSAATTQWIRDGLLVPMNDYLDTLPALKEAMADLGWTATDGLYYGYPYINQYKSSNQTLSFRQDWLEKLNLEVPKTLNDFYNVLVAFTKNDPDGNGEDDTYGFSSTQPIGNFDFIFYAYGRPYADFGLSADGQVIPWFEGECFKPGMEYLCKLWNEGLIDPEFMLNSKEKMEEKFYQSKIGYMTTYLFRHVSRIENNLKQIVSEGKLGFSYPPQGPDGSFGYAGAGRDGLFTSVTMACKNPEKAYALIDFLLSEEGENLVRNGIEGIHYTMDGDKIVYNEEERAKDGFAANGWCHPLAWGSLNWPIDAQYLPETEPERDRALESARIAGESLKPNLIARKPNSQIEYGKMLDDIYNQYFIDMLTGKLDIDTGIAELSEKWRSQNGDAVLQEANELYQSQSK